MSSANRAVSFPDIPVFMTIPQRVSSASRRLALANVCTRPGGNARPYGPDVLPKRPAGGGYAHRRQNGDRVGLPALIRSGPAARMEPGMPRRFDAVGQKRVMRMMAPTTAQAAPRD